MPSLTHGESRRPSGVTVFSSLFPSPGLPAHGMFVAELCRSLARHSRVAVVAPINGMRHLRETKTIPNGPRGWENWDGIPVRRPVYFAVPLVLKTLDAFLLARWCEPAFRSALRSRNGVVHAHYAYPEGVAAVRLGRKYGVPVVLTVHGSDIHVLSRDPARRFQIADALRKAAAVVAVSKDLARNVQSLTGSGFHPFHIPNGVSLDRFSPGSRREARRKLGLDEEKRYVLGVGRLEPVKAYDRLVESLRYLPDDVVLILAGDGSRREALREQARSAGLAERVRFVGSIAHDRLRLFYRAADMLVIGSHSEGWPTIILEALACGTPVVAHRVGGIPEALGNSDCGLLIPDNSPDTLADAIDRGFRRSWDRERLVSFAAGFSWDRIAREYLRLFSAVSTPPVGTSR